MILNGQVSIVEHASRRIFYIDVFMIFMVHGLTSRARRISVTFTLVLNNVGRIPRF